MILELWIVEDFRLCKTPPMDSSCNNLRKICRMLLKCWLMALSIQQGNYFESLFQYLVSSFSNEFPPWFPGIFLSLYRIPMSRLKIDVETMVRKDRLKSYKRYWRHWLQCCQRYSSMLFFSTIRCSPSGNIVCQSDRGLVALLPLRAKVRRGLAGLEAFSLVVSGITSSQ